MDEHDALAAQRERGLRLRHRLRALGDAYYDPPAALLRQRNEFFPRFTGHTVAQSSLEYALLLLAGEDRIYGIDDAIEGNRIIRRILEHQDLRPGSESYGNFFWMTHWDRVKDRNAVSFLAPGLAHAYLTLRDTLEAETEQALERAFEPMLAGVFSHPARWSYSNIFFLNLGAVVALSRILDDAEAHARAVERFGEWLGNTSEDGLHEFNSPTYTPVTITGIEFAWAYALDDRFRARLARTLDYMSYQFAANLFPTGFPAGAASRAYLRDITRGNGLGSWWAHVKLGTPLRDLPTPGERSARLIPVNFTLLDYVPPPAVRELAAARRNDVLLDRTVSLGSRRTHVMTPGWSLATQQVARVGGHSPSPYLLLVRDSDHPRASVVIAPDETFSHRPCAGFDVRQESGRALARLHCRPTDEELAKAQADPDFICEPRLLLGAREEIAAVRVGNVDWGGAPVALDPGQAVALSYGDLHLGVLVLPMTDAGDPAEGRMTLAFGDDDDLRLRVVLFSGEREPVDALVLIDVRDADGDLAEYAGWLRRWELSRRGGGDEPGLTATHPDEPPLHWPLSGDEDPLGDALHRSDAMAIRPGDLAAWVEGQMRIEALARPSPEVG